VAAAAVHGWTLLLSTLPGHRLSAPFVEAALGSLAGQLYSDAVDVREAAGEAIALLYDAAGLADLEGDSGALPFSEISPDGRPMILLVFEGFPITWPA
jgi:hypothetical protein